ncbi:DUF4185 domain-containing protein [Actinokineospora cianjurensis]|uniref:Uncharacterized protein DUF4185 n=1 Tax=Actinokineospora cianjurensis TaxID=585224 RepID=A0A421B5K8_9PSEU|nr:DUF4185 domain-containing protein [Actinokineospora cianjurensis]RLK59553.1 uncharacterized protein DUF4185 [Actinokineospora cianjurensis]
MTPPIGTTLIAKITGHDSANDTARRFGVHATDLGLLWADAAGRTFVLFGDTYGEGWCGDGAGPSEGSDWRCNFLAVSTDRDLDNGLRFDAVITGPGGHARQVLDRDPRIDEETVIPCSGVAIGDTHYLHYMSVRAWGSRGRWTTNYSGIAVSTDDGETWDKPMSARWINRAERDHPFQMGAFALGENYLYLLGTPNGRWGSASLARVAKDDVLDTRAYDYWNGAGWYPRDEFRAVPVMQGNVAELSVIYSVHFGRWLAIHLDEALGALVLRSAKTLTGPWSEGRVIVTSQDSPGLYGGFIHPASAHGPVIYFTMSLWQSYNVYLMRTDLGALAAEGSDAPVEA